MTQGATLMRQTPLSPPLFSTIWGNEVLFLPLHPCTVVLSGFLQSTTIAVQIPLKSIPFLFLAQGLQSTAGLCDTAGIIHALLQMVLQEGPSGHQLPKCAFACPPAPVQVCNSASPCQVLSHQRSSWVRGWEDAAYLLKQQRVQTPLWDLCS